MIQVWQDLRFAVRQVRKSRGFAVTTTLTLALGIGATTAIFSLVNTVLLRPLPFPQQERLVWTQQLDQSVAAKGIPESLSYPDFFDWRAHNHSFDAMAAYRHNSLTLTGSGTPQQLETQVVSSEFFRVLGVNPVLGRGFLLDDEKSGTHVAVLSHELWQSTFSGAADIVGQAITLDGIRYTVVGVMPKGFEYPIQNPAPALWTTLADDAVGKRAATSARGADMLSVVARLKPGVTLPQATADLSLIARNIATQFADTNKGYNAAIVKPEMENLVGETRPALRVLFAAVIFVLLIACANVAGLMLARASRRRPEIAIRSAMGATRLEIMRQVLVESVFLSLCGGALGISLSVILLRTMLRLVPQNLPRLDQVSVNAAVLAFTALTSILTGVLFGVLPAWRMSQLDPSLALREGTRNATSGRGQHRLHNSLVIAETAIGLVLLVGAGLLIRSFVRVLHVDPGFDSRNVLTASLNLPDSQYPGIKRVKFYEQLLPKLAALPGVQSVAAGWPIPLGRGDFSISFTIEGRPIAKGDEPSEQLSAVTPDFFRTLRIPVLAGRAFRPTDDSKSMPVIIVNEAFARKYFPGENPIGKHIQSDLGDGITEHPMREVVGIVGNVKRRGITTDAPPQYYLPFPQAVITSPSLEIRTTGDPVSIASALRARLAEMDGSIPLYRVRTLEDYVSQSAAQPRFQTLLITFFAAMALLLSAIGLYAVLSYMVAQRTLEIGLRLALGAQRSDVLGLILRRGATLAVTGLGIGILVSLLLTHFLAAMLYGIRPFDPLTFVGVSLVLLLVSLAASMAPAYRAARLDPMGSLREQ